MLSLGGTATLENSSKSVSQYSLGASLAQDDSELAISTTDKFNLFKVTNAIRIEDTTALAGKSAG